MNEYDDLTAQLSRTLTDHADELSATSLGLAEVKGRARSIRRRRTATAVVGAAAAVALLVPTVALASHTGGTKNEPAPATQTPTQTPTPTTTATPDQGGHQPAPGILDVSDLPTGAAPRMEYVTGGRTLHQIDGSTVDIATRYPISSFVVLTDGSHLWLTTHQGTPYVEVEDGTGTFHDPVPSGWALSVNSTHSLAAWIRPDGQVMAWNLGSTEPVAYGDPVPAGSDLRMGPVLGDSCGPKGYCEVYVNVPDQQTGEWQPWLVDVNGTQKYTDGSYRILADSTESGLSIGYRKITDSGTCSDLLGAGEFQGFETCQHTLVSFSPDEKLLLADPAYHSGIGNGVIAMYDLKGKVQFERHSTAKTQAFYPEAQWEDATHVLAPVFQDGHWAIVRIASDGSMEYAVAPIAGEDMTNPYVLATGGPALGD
jgi:hypothetical protein